MSKGWGLKESESYKVNTKLVPSAETKDIPEIDNSNK